MITRSKRPTDKMDPQGTGYVGPEELKGLQRTFNLYVENPKEMWGDIKLAESFRDKGNAKFYDLATDYQMYCFGRSLFSVTNTEKNSINIVESR